MFVLAGFCDMHWLMSWILPFLLGLALGWWIWSRFKKQVADLEGQIRGHKSTIGELEAALKDCKSRRADLESDLALTKGKMRELEGELTRVKKDNKGSGNAISALAATGAASVAAPVEPVKKATTTGGKVKGYAGLANDNLQIIEGVGPKMESILKENGISNWSELSTNSESDLRAVLNKYGDKYRIIDPATWGVQAGLAASGDWAGLSKMQSELDGGKATGTGTTDAKVDKMLVRLGLKRKFKQDDLKVVEGIGPKIEGLLHDAGIKTWRALADSEVLTIQGVLDAAGSRYKLADPGTWPKQADMADKGQWDELDEYQDFLQGGK